MKTGEWDLLGTVFYAEFCEGHVLYLFDTAERTLRSVQFNKWLCGR